MRKALIAVILLFGFLAGCQSLRFAPSELQKQNAWLCNRTAMITAQTAKEEDSSQKLQGLTKLAELQSRAFPAYFGLPKEYPPAETAEDVLSQSNFILASRALNDSTARPDGWEMADSAIELGIGLCALLGGAYGLKAAQFLRLAKTKSNALREIVSGNELFKKQNDQFRESFKQAHKNQSPKTRQIVAEMK
ncbi:MAG: hypothetical protein FVQ80_01280 [Planctomycetes bacterium]|nr:hypothetical protein [Planctomycetota bacterium]